MSGRKMFWRHLLVTPGFRYTTLLRYYHWASANVWCGFGLRQLIGLMLRHYTIRFGIDISPDAKIGSGLYIGHFGGIVVNREVVIGNNCNLSHRVTLGQVNRGDKVGCPVIGNNVFIAPGAVVIGRIQIGDFAAIGANAVVVGDVAERTTVGGIPARPISNTGSEGYVNRTDYPPIPVR
jgi:serine O-acetyltransferase